MHLSRITLVLFVLFSFFSNSLIGQAEELIKYEDKELSKIESEINYYEKINDLLNFYLFKNSYEEQISLKNEMIVALKINNIKRLEAQYYRYNQVKYKLWERDFPSFFYCWFQLKEAGFNDYVIAGILGNLMVETGGRSFYLDPYAIDQNLYYGICQWNLNYYPTVKNNNLIEQVDFLISTIDNELNTFGFLYRENFNYQDFCSLVDTDEVALSFAMCYERCHKSSYQDRQECAQLAFKVFRERRGSFEETYDLF